MKVKTKAIIKLISRYISILMHKIIFGQKNTKLKKINRTNVMKVHILYAMLGQNRAHHITIAIQGLDTQKKKTYERALRAIKCNLDKCSVSLTLIAIPKPNLRSS